MLNESQKRTKRAPFTDALISKQPTKVRMKKTHNIELKLLLIIASENVPCTQQNLSSAFWILKEKTRGDFAHRVHVVN